MTKCKQCGKCCHRGDFWQHSNHQFVKYLATALRCKGSFVRRKLLADEGPCLMLTNHNFCAIEITLGRDAKPDICKEYECEDK